MALTVDELLQKTVEVDGSDLHLKVGSPPLLRRYGILKPMDMKPLTEEMVHQLAFSIISEHERAAFERDLELDFAYHIPGLARFRGNMFNQRMHLGVVFRVIPLKIRTIQELELPPVCTYYCQRPRGLVLVTGPAGSGKSTTQAAMIDYINENYTHHIITVEDPVEFVHEDKRSLINHRQLGMDTNSFANALKYSLREDPDVILIGEMRDLETIQLAITAAETGHLVLGTLHTTDAVQTIDRVIDVFPTYQQEQVRMQVSVNLVGVVSQSLVPKADGNGRVPAFETMVAVPAIRNLIREAKTYQIASTIQTGTKQGMMTMDQSLADLVKKGLVTYDAALDKSINPFEFKNIIDEWKAKRAADAALAARRR